MSKNFLFPLFGGGYGVVWYFMLGLSFPNYPLFQGSNQLWKSGDWDSCWHTKQCTSPNYLTSLISWTTRKTDTKQGHYKNTKSYEITPQKYLQSALLPKLNVPFNKMLQSQGFHFRFSDGVGGRTKAWRGGNRTSVTMFSGKPINQYSIFVKR